MKILITGADGMVARATAAYCSEIGDSVTAVNRAGLDITDRTAVGAALTDGTFDALINCAAFTDVDGAESNAEACYAANAYAVGDLASACAAAGTRFVTISTDYVFDGNKNGIYTEEDLPAPLGTYGKAKLEGERLAAAANVDSVIVRSGWIFGPHGTNFLSVMHRLLANGRRIKAIRDSFGTPTFAMDLARALRDLAASDCGGIFHVVNKGSGTSYLGFAKAVCEAGGFDAGLIDPVSADELSRPAPRPRDSRMASVRLENCGIAELPGWREAIARFVSSELTAK